MRRMRRQQTDKLVVEQRRHERRLSALRIETRTDWPATWVRSFTVTGGPAMYRYRRDGRPIIDTTAGEDKKTTSKSDWDDHSWKRHVSFTVTLLAKTRAIWSITYHRYGQNGVGSLTNACPNRCREWMVPVLARSGTVTGPSRSPGRTRTKPGPSEVPPRPLDRPYVVVKRIVSHGPSRMRTVVTVGRTTDRRYLVSSHLSATQTYRLSTSLPSAWLVSRLCARNNWRFSTTQ